MKHQPLSTSKDYGVSFSVEDGTEYVGTHQNIDPVIDHVKKVRDMHSHATAASNPNEWRHVGSVPMSMIVDWVHKSPYTFAQWARNEDGAKDKFLKYFLSRDFSKLHNQHVTTKRESSQITMPKSIARDAVDLTGIGK